ncbi:CARDB domain-containing protein [Natranaeroarchaeum aerophilus]|uniref:Type IV pilin n=1 Tax=Natranaeroarchaeum aerophilus TaxID=2917711 RepID=A0AAE3K4H3_9EURY|nr:CARDB domain-containing protein [Natranaeroarchaeum aerophilus]MCL9812635.1 type IV pilin [Natranaeroarchaeum aerophilus]
MTPTIFPSLPADKRAVSPVIGVVLMIAIFVTIMAVIGGFALAANPAEPSPHGEFKAIESPDGNVTLIADRGTNVPEDQVEVYVGGVECTGVWDGSGTIETSDEVEFDECNGQPIDQGDSVSVIWNSGGGSSSTFSSHTVRTDLSGGTYFAVSIDDYDNDVDARDTVKVEYTVENTRSDEGTQDIEFRIDGTVEGTEDDLTLDEGDTHSDTFSYTTDGSDTPEIDVRVASDDDGVTEAVTVSGGAGGTNFEVSIDTTNSPVEEGEDLDVTAEITNTGSENGDQTITLDVGGEQRDSESVDVDDGETETVTLRWSTSDGDTGDYTAIVASEDASDDTGVEVESDGAGDPVNFEVDITGTNSPVEEDEELTVTADIENTGSEDGDQTIALEIDGEQKDSQSVDVDAGETETVTLTWSTSNGDAGDYMATVASEDDSDMTDVTVTEDESETPVEVESVSAESNDVHPNEVDNVDFNVEVDNPGNTDYEVEFVVKHGGESDEEQGPEVNFEGTYSFSGFDSTKVNNGNPLPVEVIVQDDTGTTSTCTGELTDQNQEIDLNCD